MACEADQVLVDEVKSEPAGYATKTGLCLSHVAYSCITSSGGRVSAAGLPRLELSSPPLYRPRASGGAQQELEVGREGAHRKVFGIYATPRVSGSLQDQFAEFLLAPLEGAALWSPSALSLNLHGCWERTGATSEK